MLKKCDFVGIIPSRYGSTRFPGKPLALIDGLPMIERVYRQASLALDRVVVATDDERIRDVVRKFGGEVVMTSQDCVNGTERVGEAFKMIGSGEKVVINIQGDEPFIQPNQIELVMSLFMENPRVEIATLACHFDPAEGFEALFDPNRVKMTMDDGGRVLYFSRSIIPYVRNYKWQEWLDHATFYTHVGLYGFRADVLENIVNLRTATSENDLANVESLEQLGWLQHGYRINAAITHEHSHPIDTPEDIERLTRPR